MYLRESASRAFTLLTKNPPLFGRVLLAKAKAVRPLPARPVQRRINGVSYEFESAGGGSSAAMYFGAYSPLVVNAMKRHLRPGDVFIDIGANTGYLSAVGAGLVGPQGQVHSFEPVPSYFEKVRRLAELNSRFQIHPVAAAAGNAPGSATIYITRASGQHTLVAGYKTELEVMATADIPITRLDSYIQARGIARVAAIKIDAEGFELPVLEGMRGYWETTGDRPAIICEIAPRAYALIGRSLGELKALISRYGYSVHDIIDGATPVDVTKLRHVTDVLLLAKS